MKCPYVEKVTCDGVTCDILRHSGQQCGHKVALLWKTRSVTVNQLHGRPVQLCSRDALTARGQHHVCVTTSLAKM